jgi:hypothetical protein
MDDNSNNENEVFRIGNDLSAEFYGNSSFLKFCREENAPVDFIYFNRLISKINKNS